MYNEFLAILYVQFISGFPQMEFQTAQPPAMRRVSEIDHPSHATEEPILPQGEWKKSRGLVLRERITKTLRNPLSLVLLTWLIMALLLWWEVARQAR
jgi:hypothetical protein